MDATKNMREIPSIYRFSDRLQELDRELANPDLFQDGRRAAAVSREHRKLTRLLEAHERLTRLDEEIAEHEELACEAAGDEELRELAEEELPELRQRREQILDSLLMAMVPADKSDSRNTVVEIRAGAGGDEASLFAADLYRMYSRCAESRGWRVESLNASPSECGGFKEIAFLVSGEDVYRDLKFESGVHRVQRVPVTEANGRIHTSTATVAVLPEAEDVDVEVDPADLDITVSRASGPGGQHVNTTDSAVQILHKPSGTIVHCADERSQHKNKNKALKVLRARLLKAKEEEERARYAAHRRDQIGTGDRSERIRTYNFPQSRLTDHRIHLTLYNLPGILEGELHEVIAAMQDADTKLKIAEMLNSGSLA